MNTERKQIETLSLTQIALRDPEFCCQTTCNKSIVKRKNKRLEARNNYLESEIMRVSKIADDLHAENIQLKQVQNDLIEGR